jgi:P-type Ca2+ transporter type 2C
VALLAVAAGVSVALGNLKDACAILAIVVLNVLLGFRQERRAEKGMAALSKLAVPAARVRRDGLVQEVPARLLVRGDVVLLEAGNLVPADVRILSAQNLRIQEASLTGESVPVDKGSAALAGEELLPAERTNMAFAGTHVASGHGAGAVTATGMDTELGAIAGMLRSVAPEPTPLQRRMAQLGGSLAAAAVALIAVVFLLGILRGEPVGVLFLTAVSLAVAAVPEGLPAVVTTALSLGAQRMLRRRALIRRLPSVETLGQVTVICSDKTGTLTENRMRVAVLEGADGSLDAAGSGTAARALLLAGGALCNDAILTRAAAEDPSLRVLGDPTEAALVEAAARSGLRKDELERDCPRVAEAGFDSGRKRMTTVHAVSPEPGVVAACLELLQGGAPRYVAFTKGAVDGLLEVCAAVWTSGGLEPLTGPRRERILAANDRMAGEGLRVLGVAFRALPDLPGRADAGSLERELVFVGMAGLIDPPRPEVPGAVERCRSAGIRAVMITGDHARTALSVAGSVGIARDGSALTGAEIAALSDDDLAVALGKASVCARVAPEQKLRVVSLLQRMGHVVAVTGDGVNDAPALKKANIGVAMGIAGTDVAKEAADMVLLDDNFATIVAAVEEGRAIYGNVRKFIRYILMSNFGEIGVMLAGPFLGMPLPLLPLQILWVNLVTDGPPALALAVEPAESDAMRRPPPPPSEHVLAGGMVRDILSGGLVVGLVSLGGGYVLWRGGSESLADDGILDPDGGPDGERPGPPLGARLDLSAGTAHQQAAPGRRPAHPRAPGRPGLRPGAPGGLRDGSAVAGRGGRVAWARRPGARVPGGSQERTADLKNAGPAGPPWFPW